MVQALVAFMSIEGIAFHGAWSFLVALHWPTIVMAWNLELHEACCRD
jgi:hypothetical protein